MKTKGHLPFAATVLFFVIVCCNELVTGKPSDRSERVTQDSELHQDQRTTADAFVDGQAASGSNPGDRGVLTPKKPLSLTARLSALLENARHEEGIKKKRFHTRPRPKRNPNYGEASMTGMTGQVPQAAGADPGSPFGGLDDYELVDSILFADWSECNVSCGIGYQTLGKSCDDQSACESEGRHEWRRCLGIDCKSPEYLEHKLACSGGGSASSIVIGIVAGIIITLATGGAVTYIKRFKSGKSSKPSSSKTKKKSSKRPPMPPPRDGEAKDADGEHIYAEVDGQSNKKARASNEYVSMKKKEKSKKEKGGKRKSKKKPESEDSDHTYVDPDELNQPESEDLEIQRLRDPPAPPSGRKSKKSSKRKEENEYEVPMENDYIEIDE